jgi:hypothetical protein
MSASTVIVAINAQLLGREHVRRASVSNENSQADGRETVTDH